MAFIFLKDIMNPEEFVAKVKLCIQDKNLSLKDIAEIESLHDNTVNEIINLLKENYRTLATDQEVFDCLKRQLIPT